MNREEFKESLLRGNTGEYSHMIVYCDRFDYTDIVCYVEYGENISKVIEHIKSLGSPGMFYIEEIYNYNLDLDKQLNEKRSYHIEPVEKSRKVIDVNEDSTNISEKLKKAIEFANKKHDGQTRKDGTPYMIHPLRVLKNVLKFKKSKYIENLLITACLHDTLEDTNTTYYELISEFGSEVASLVLELTSDSDMKRLLGKETYLKIKMKNMSSWALVIKLCDRLDNVIDLDTCNDIVFKDKYMLETIEIINYLINNRYLSNTHLDIIESIIDNLFRLCENDINNKIKVKEFNNYYSELGNINNRIYYLNKEFDEYINNCLQKKKIY